MRTLAGLRLGLARLRMRAHMPALARACEHARAHACMHACAHARTHARMQACAHACVAWPSQAVAQPGSSCEGVVKGFKTKSLAEVGASKPLGANSLFLESWGQTSPSEETACYWRAGSKQAPGSKHLVTKGLRVNKLLGVSTFGDCSPRRGSPDAGILGNAVSSSRLLGIPIAHF